MNPYHLELQNRGNDHFFLQAHNKVSVFWKDVKNSTTAPMHPPLSLKLSSLSFCSFFLFFPIFCSVLLCTHTYHLGSRTTTTMVEVVAGGGWFRAFREYDIFLFWERKWNRWECKLRLLDTKITNVSLNESRIDQNVESPKLKPCPVESIWEWVLDLLLPFPGSLTL